MSEAQKYTDLNYLNNFSDGNEKFVREVVVICVEQTTKEIINLKAALAAGEFKRIGQICHKLRSSMGFMGISAEVTEKLKQLESFAMNGPDEFKAETARMIEIVSRVKDELQEVVNRTKEAH